MDGDAAHDRIENGYYQFMDFDLDNARKVLGYYTRFFSDEPVLELAPGPGVFLDLLREAGVSATGVDIDPGMVERARDRGHDVVLGDAISHLEGLPDASLGGLFAAHFLEHLPAPQVVAVYREAARTLRPGGAFVAVVPNAGCLSVLGYDFWRDPTHVRFYDPLCLELFARESALTADESGGNPENHPGAPPGLLHVPPSPQPGMKSEISQLVTRAEALVRAQDGSNLRPPEGMCGELGNILAVMSDRIAGLQHDVHALGLANERLLAQLYPPNEVYVVARRPLQSEDPPSHG